MKHWLLILSLVTGWSGTVYAQTISEKKASLSHHGSEFDKETETFINHTNEDINIEQQVLRQLYKDVQEKYQTHAPVADYQELLNQINTVKKNIKALEEEWRQRMANTDEGEEPYALWYQPDTTLEQLVVEYGSQDYVYLIPNELKTMRFSVSSNLPIPRASWEDMLEIILAQNGVGITQLNPYLRQLTPLKKDFSNIEVLTDKREELSLYPEDTRIAFILHPQATDVRRLYSFLLKFSNPETTAIQQMGREILIVASVETVEEVLKLYDFTSSQHAGKDYRFFALTKIHAEEMETILSSIFLESSSKKSGNIPPGVKGQRDVTHSEEPGPRIITLSNFDHAIFIMGTPEELRKAEEIIDDIQSQLGEVREKTVFWYTVKHSEPEDLAVVLEKVYNLIKSVPNPDEFPPMPEPEPKPLRDDSPTGVPFYAGGHAVVDPSLVVPLSRERVERKSTRENFIVDAKSGSIVMVVETDLLARLKELIKRLDVPKKMVKIDVLLFEKRMNDANNYGLNLLRLGGFASNTNFTGVRYNDVNSFDPDFGILGNSFGILDFMISGKSTCQHAAYDLAYNFLVSQDDVTLNACPSVTTVNQTPATIALVDEISINVGSNTNSNNNNNVLADSYARAQYGITIEILPIIHFSDEEDEYSDGVDYLTLDTDITFDTIQPSLSGDSRPDVTRRNIKNEVRVADGETIILGGLRRLSTSDSKQFIPFLGEVPGIGKLFGSTEMVDSSTEMFIFITPHIIVDDCEERQKMLFEELNQRPGDHPELLRCLEEGRCLRDRCLFEGGLRMLFGRPEDL